MDAMESAKTSPSKDTFLALEYEDFCSDPLDTFRTVTEFCELKWTAEFEKRSERLSCPSLTPFTKTDRLTPIRSRRRGNVGYSAFHDDRSLPVIFSSFSISTPKPSLSSWANCGSTGT